MGGRQSEMTHTKAFVPLATISQGRVSDSIFKLGGGCKKRVVHKISRFKAIDVGEEEGTSIDVMIKIDGGEPGVQVGMPIAELSRDEKDNEIFSSKLGNMRSNGKPSIIELWSCSCPVTSRLLDYFVREEVEGMVDSSTYDELGSSEDSSECDSDLSPELVITIGIYQEESHHSPLIDLLFLDYSLAAERRRSTGACRLVTLVSILARTYILVPSSSRFGKRLIRKRVLSFELMVIGTIVVDFDNTLVPLQFIPPILLAPKVVILDEEDDEDAIMNDMEEDMVNKPTPRGSTWWCGLTLEDQVVELNSVNVAQLVLAADLRP
ncbi:hypothetical protein ACFE04_029900 [Oxalis oulophora]